MSSDEEIGKPPERRVASSRVNKGSRMAKLIAEDANDEAEEGDKEFYNQGFWEDDEEDGEFEANDGDDEGGDSFDSDFGDSTESDEDDDDEKKVTSREKQEKIARRKSVYKDPKAAKKAEKDGGAGPSSGAPAKKSHKKRSRAEGAELVVEQNIQRGSLRASTQGAAAIAAVKRRESEEAMKRRQERAKEMAKGRPGVELRRLTQEEILAEAKQTEIINRASLEKMLRQEEEKRKVVLREHDTSGPRIKTLSRRRGDSVVSTYTFIGAPVPVEINDIAPNPPPPLRCAVTGQIAKYIDPLTGSPYASLEAFRVLRGKSGRRSTSLGTAGGSAEQ